MRSFSPGSTSTYRSLGMESSLTFPLLGTTCTSMMVSVRLPISSSSGLVSTPSTSTLSGPSVISSSPNILSTQLLGEASTSSGSGWDAWVSVIKERGPAKSSKPKTKATSMTGNDHIHQRMRRGFRRSLVYPWKSLIHRESSTLRPSGSGCHLSAFQLLLFGSRPASPEVPLPAAVGVYARRGASGRLAEMLTSCRRQRAVLHSAEGGKAAVHGHYDSVYEGGGAAAEPDQGSCQLFGLSESACGGVLDDGLPSL